jgi:hypothetical protein
MIESGTFISEAYKAEHWDDARPGDLANYADIRWNTILSDGDLLPLATLDAHVPGLPWLEGIQGSGAMLPSPGGAALEKLWAQHIGMIPPQTNTEKPPEPGKGRHGQAWQTDPVRNLSRWLRPVGVRRLVGAGRRAC